MIKRPPAIQYLSIDIDGNPIMLESVSELRVDFGEALNASIIAVLLVWDFKVYETLSKNKLLLESRIQQEHRFDKFNEVTLKECEEIILESYNESREIFHGEIKKDNINHQLEDMPDEPLRKYSAQLFDDSKKRLF